MTRPALLALLAALCAACASTPQPPPPRQTSLAQLAHAYDVDSMVNRSKSCIVASRRTSPSRTNGGP